MFDFKIKTFFGRLMISHIVIILISLVVIGIMFGYLVQNYFYGLREYEAINNTRRIARYVEQNVLQGDIHEVDMENVENKIQTIARSSDMNIGLMNAEGDLLIDFYDSDELTIPLEEEEIRYVLDGNTITRKIMGPKEENLVMLAPMIEKEGETADIQSGAQSPQSDDPGRVVGSIIIGAPLGGFAATANNISRMIAFSFLVALIAATFLALPFARRVTDPLEKLKKAAQNIASGEFKPVHIPHNSSEEIKLLGQTFNYAGQQIQRTLEEQQQLEMMRKEFVQDVSHEFRAPLTSVKGFLELLSDSHNGLDPDEKRRYLEIMYKDTEYLEHLLSDLLDLAKLDSNELNLELNPVQPGKMVRRAVDSMQNKSRERKVDIEVAIEEGLPTVKADKNRIHQVMINLLDNALNHSPENAKITVEAHRENNGQNHAVGSERIHFSVIDSGSGIPEDKQESIWSRFYKMEQSRKRKDNGSGLGLAIAKNIVEEHEGEIGVESKPGEGSRFYFLLPSSKSSKIP